MKTGYGGKQAFARLAGGVKAAKVSAVALVAAGGGVTFGACSEFGANEQLIGAPSVILVVVDTLRADHLSGYGYSRATSYKLDAFGTDAAVFEANWAQAPCTYPSVNSLLTSRNPREVLGDLSTGDIGIPEGVPTMASILAEQGYVTQAVSASPIVRKTPSSLSQGGFDVGFHGFDEDCVWRGARCVNNGALEILRGLRREELRCLAEQEEGEVCGNRPFFLYLHYMDPHDPYRTTPGYPAQFSEPGVHLEGWVKNGNPNPLYRKRYREHQRLEVAPSVIDHLMAMYDDVIYEWDRRFDRFKTEVEAMNLGEHLLWVIASDHGEAFLEHGHIKHCRNLYDHTIRTPLIIRGLGIEPVRVKVPSANLDILPTVLDYVFEGRGERSIPWESFDGKSLRAVMEGEDEEFSERVVFSARGNWRAAMGQRFKLLHHVRAKTYRLFDHREDPGELNDVSGDQPEALARLARALQAWMQRGEEMNGTRPGLKDAEERLRAVGYL